MLYATLNNNKKKLLIVAVEVCFWRTTKGQTLIESFYLNITQNVLATYHKLKYVFFVCHQDGSRGGRGGEEGRLQPPV